VSRHVSGSVWERPGRVCDVEEGGRTQVNNSLARVRKLVTIAG
jgi:hypothetical protein